MASTLSLLKLPILPTIKPRSKPLPFPSISSKLNVQTPQKLFDQNIINTTLKNTSLSLTAITFPFLLEPNHALAVGGEFGILEGRTFALIHPIVLGGFFFYTLYAGYLGWQWRRVRTTQNEINELKKQIKPVPVTPDGKQVESSPPSPLELKIQQLTEVPTPSALLYASFIVLSILEELIDSQG